MKTSHGRGFEQQVQNSAAHYERKQILTLRKVEPPTRVVGGGAARKVIFLDNPFLDFVGSWTERRGRMIVLEAKETHEPRLPYGGGLTERQLEAMHRWWQVGAAVGLVWNWQTGGGLGVRTFFSLPQIVAGLQTKRHLKPVDGDVVEQGQGLCLVDFLPLLRRL